MCARTARPRGRWRRLLRLALLSVLPPLALAAAVATVLWVRGGESFRLHEWTAAGILLADQRHLEAVLDAERGRPLAGLDLDRVRDRLAEDPWIVGLRLAKDWPDALSVSLREDEPLAWVLRGGAVEVLAASGRLLPLPAAGVALDLPVVAGHADWARLAADLAVLKHEFPALYARAQRLAWGPFPQLTLSGSEARVLLRADQWRHGLTLLQIVVHQRPRLLGKGGELDLRFVNQVVWRPGNA